MRQVSKSPTRAKRTRSSGRLRPHFALRRSRRRSTRGMTLIEIMVVVAIIAVVGGSAAVVALNFLGDAKTKVAAKDADTIKSIAIRYLFDNSGCPTVNDLLDEGMLDEDKNNEDPWGGSYEIECRGDNVVVTSPGPDGDLDTDDDVTTKRNRDTP